VLYYLILLSYPFLSLTIWDPPAFAQYSLHYLNYLRISYIISAKPSILFLNVAFYVLGGIALLMLLIYIILATQIKLSSPPNKLYSVLAPYYVHLLNIISLESIDLIVQLFFCNDQGFLAITSGSKSNVKCLDNAYKIYMAIGILFLLVIMINHLIALLFTNRIQLKQCNAYSRIGMNYDQFLDILYVILY